MVITILMLLAFVLLAVCAAGVPSPPRFQLGWAGLAVWVLAQIMGGLKL
jgi:hypothetical protein